MHRISDFQKQRCLSVMDDISRRSTSQMFAEPVDPIRDNLPKYFKIVKRPMDLRTVREKLEGDKYETVDDWKSDMELIWENAFLYNGKSSYMYDVAKHLQNVFKELTANLSSNELYDWVVQLEFWKNEVNRIAKTSPKQGQHQQQQKAQQKKIPTRQSNDNIKSRSHSKTSLSAKEKMQIEEDEDENEFEQEIIIETPSKSRSAHSRNKKTSSSTSKENVREKEKEKTKEKEPTPEPEVETYDEPQIEDEDLQKLIDQINHIEDVRNILQLIAIIKKNENSIQVIENEFNEVEIEVSKLKNHTILELKKYISTIV